VKRAPARLMEQALRMEKNAEEKNNFSNNADGAY